MVPAKLFPSIAAYADIPYRYKWDQLISS